MIKMTRKNYAMLGAAFTLGMMDTSAHAAAAGGGITAVGTTEYSGMSGGFSTIFERVATSFGGLPGLITTAAYIMGIIFAIGGILKIKDHVENPGQTDLKSGAIRLVVGGALFALPFVMSVMTATVGDQTDSVAVTTLKKAKFGFGS